MKFKRLLSLVLCVVMIFSMSTEVFAITLNMNIDGEEIIQVETGTDQFFNVTFAPKEYKPNAEQIYTLYMGQNYDMWRYSGDQDKNKKGNQPWRTSWGILSDYEMGELMDGHNPNAVIYLNEQLPQGVKNFLSSGGSWEDIKVTFQCENTDGICLEPKMLFVNEAVDCWIKWGTEVQLAFKPYFRGANQMISNTTSMQVKRGLYPYSNTMFSMWGKNGGHKGATMVHDDTQNEPDGKYAGYSLLHFDHILDNKGNLIANQKYKNIEYGAKPSFKDFIDSNTTNIGYGTFDNGGAVGISFHFPVKITFEINPIKAQKPNSLYVSEYSIVNMADDADPDEMTTHASMQAYSNRAQ